MQTTDLINQIRQTPTYGVYALVNNADKRVQVCYSNFIPEAVVRTLKKLSTNRHKSVKMTEDQGKLELVFLERLFKQIDQKLALKKWVDYYSELGFEHYTKYTIANMRIKYEIGRSNHKAVVQVLLLSNRKNKILVGTFDSMPDAKSWVSHVYPKNKVTKVIKHIGEINAQ